MKLNRQRIDSIRKISNLKAHRDFQKCREGLEQEEQVKVNVRVAFKKKVVVHSLNSFILHTEIITIQNPFGIVIP
jgi:hypothetical protein